MLEAAHDSNVTETDGAIVGRSVATEDSSQGVEAVHVIYFGDYSNELEIMVEGSGGEADALNSVFTLSLDGPAQKFLAALKEVLDIVFIRKARSSS